MKSRKIQTHSDFAVAGRSLSPWVLVGTMLATWIGTGSILGNAGEAYNTGLAALILPVGGVLGIVLLTQIAAKVREQEVFTVPEIIQKRFGPVAGILAIVALVSAYMVIVSYQYNAGAAIIHTIFVDSNGEALLSIGLATVIAAIIIITYTMLAGLLSVAFTDVGNGILMTIVLIIAIPIMIIKTGGLSGMENAFLAMDKASHMNFFGVYSGWDYFNFLLPPFLLILGDANMYQRFSAAKDAKGSKSAVIVLIFVVLIVELAIVSLAWMSSSLVPDAGNGRHILIYTAFHFMPPLLGALMLATIIGIIISTADSYLLVPATTLIRDIYQKYINPKANDKKVILMSRLVVLILGLIAYFISLGFARSSGFFERALYAYTIYGAAITPTLIAALFWKKATKEGAIFSISSGIIVTLLWKETGFFLLFLPSTIISSVDEVVPAALISILGLILVSLKTYKEEPQVETWNH